jgi:hypothetical protein
MTYAAQLAITATSAWQTWYQASDRACRYTAAAWQWYTATFFSEKVTATYCTIGEIIGHIAILIILMGRICRLHVQAWVDSEVEASAAPAPVEDMLQLPDPMEEAATLAEKPAPAPAAAAAMAEPVAIAVIPAEPDYADMNSAQLRKECSKAGIQWRNAHGRNKHMSKGEMLKALGG